MTDFIAEEAGDKALDVILDREVERKAEATSQKVIDLAQSLKSTDEELITKMKDIMEEARVEIDKVA